MWQSGKFFKCTDFYTICVTDDDTRVVLSEIEGVPGSDYINANFIDVRSKMIYFCIVSCRTICWSFLQQIQFLIRLLFHCHQSVICVCKISLHLARYNNSIKCLAWPVYLSFTHLCLILISRATTITTSSLLLKVRARVTGMILANKCVYVFSVWHCSGFDGHDVE